MWRSVTSTAFCHSPLHSILPHARHITESSIIWLQLVHPGRKAQALAKLRQEMQDPSQAVKRVVFALVFLSVVQPQVFAQSLKRREAMGGLDGEDLHAAFVLTLNKNEPRGVGELHHRASPAT